MIKINERHIITAFGNKSQSRIRYLLFSDQADKENLPNLARLFRAIAFSECIQARNYYLKLSHLEEQFVTSTVVIAGFGDIRNSILSACTEVDFEITDIYPSYREIARSQGEKDIEKYFTWTYLIERLHKKLFRKAKEAIDKNSDGESKPLHACRVCGYIRAGEIPNKCPVCKTTKEHFTTFA